VAATPHERRAAFDLSPEVLKDVLREVDGNHHEPPE